MMFEAMLAADVDLHAESPREAAAYAVDECREALATFRFALKSIKAVPDGARHSVRADDVAYDAIRPGHADGNVTVEVLATVTFEAEDLRAAEEVAVGIPYRIAMLEAVARAARKSGLPEPLPGGPVHRIEQPGCSAENVHAFNRNLSAETGRPILIGLGERDGRPHATLTTGIAIPLAEQAIAGVLATDPGIQERRRGGAVTYMTDDRQVSYPAWATHGLTETTEDALETILKATKEAFGEVGGIPCALIPGVPASASARALEAAADAERCGRLLDQAIAVAAMANCRIDGRALRAQLARSLERR